jgi:DNA polymerase III epsilon subunit-like protein
MACKYIAYDLETGGFDCEKDAILTGYFAALNDKLELIDDLSLTIKPEEPYVNVSDGALKVNGINMSEHLSSPELVTYAEARAKLLGFIEKHSDKKSKPKNLGQNIQFDKNFIFKQLVPQGEWEKHVHYHTIDTLIVTLFLKDAGILPQEVGSLESLVRHFGLSRGQFHNAKGDVLMTVEVYKKTLSMLESFGSGGGGEDHSDLLKLLE